MYPITIGKVLSHVALRHHMKTFTKWHQILHVLIRTLSVSCHAECRSKYCVTKNGSLLGITINNHGSFLSTNVSNKFWLMIANCSIHFFWKWTDPSQPADQFWHSSRSSSRIIHSSRRSEPILHSSRCSERILHPSRSSGYFSKFSPRGRWDMSNSQPIHLIRFCWDLWHLLLDTNPTLLRCNDSFVLPSRRRHPTKKFVRRHQHDLTSAQVRTPADLASRHSQDVPERQLGRKTLMHSELLAQIVLSSSTCQVVLHLLPLILFCQRGCLSFYPRRAGPLWCHRQMRPPVEPTSAHCLFPGSVGTSPAPRSTRALFSSLSLAVSRRFCLCTQSSLLCPSRFSQWSFWFALGIRC